MIAQLNRLPGSPDVTASALDSARALSGNLVSQATDPDGDSVILTNITYAGIEYTPGAQVATSHGTLTFTQAGQWSFQMNDAAYALTNGQSATVNFTFRLRDSRGASGQTLAALDARWNGYLLFGSYNASTYYYCDGNGKLIGNYIARNNGGRAWFANDQAD